MQIDIIIEEAPRGLWYWAVVDPDKDDAVYDTYGFTKSMGAEALKLEGKAMNKKEAEDRANRAANDLVRYLTRKRRRERVSWITDDGIADFR